MRSLLNMEPLDRPSSEECLSHLYFETVDPKYVIGNHSSNTKVSTPNNNETAANTEVVSTHWPQINKPPINTADSKKKEKKEVSDAPPPTDSNWHQYIPHSLPSQQQQSLDLKMPSLKFSAAEQEAMYRHIGIGGDKEEKGEQLTSSMDQLTIANGRWKDNNNSNLPSMLSSKVVVDLDKEAEREKERQREKEIRAFRDFSTKLPIKQQNNNNNSNNMSNMNHFQLGPLVDHNLIDPPLSFPQKTPPDLSSTAKKTPPPRQSPMAVPPLETIQVRGGIQQRHSNSRPQLLMNMKQPIGLTGLYPSSEGGGDPFHTGFGSPLVATTAINPFNHGTDATLMGLGFPPLQSNSNALPHIIIQNNSSNINSNTTSSSISNALQFPQGIAGSHNLYSVPIEEMAAVPPKSNSLSNMQRSSNTNQSNNTSINPNSRNQQVTITYCINSNYYCYLMLYRGRLLLSV